MTQLVDGPLFNLAGPFARHLEFPANFFQGKVVAVQQAETQFDYLALAQGQLAQNVEDLLTQQVPLGDLDRPALAPVLDGLAECLFLFLCSTAST